MRKAVAVLLLAILVFSTSFTLFAQKTRNLQVERLPTEGPTKKGFPRGLPILPPVKVDPTIYSNIEGYTDGSSVLLRWQMEVETANFGFNVYQIDSNGRRRINQDIILGGAARIANQPAYGEEYHFQIAANGFKAAYEIESVPLSGKKVTSKTVSPQFAKDLGGLDGYTQNPLVPKLRGTGKIQANSMNLDSDLQAEVTQSTLTADPNNQKWVAAQPGAKIRVRAEGFYRVTKAQLQAAGFDVNSDPATWQLYTDGVEQAINVEASGAYVEFYGKRLDTIESDTRMYYLIAGAVQGKRIPTRFAGPRFSTVVARSYSQTFTQKERNIYLDSVLNGDANENYFGSTISTSAYTMPFTLSGVDTLAASAAMSVKFFGFSATAHPITITLNGHLLDPANGVNQGPFSGEYVIPAAYLNEGANSLKMQSTGGSTDFSFFEELDVTFLRTHMAVQNKLAFYTQNIKSSIVDGFTSPNIRVFDTTEDGSPQQLSGLAIQPNGGLFRVTLPANRPRVMYAVEDSGLLSPVSISANTPSTLSTPTRNADLVIISYKDWMTQANAWADYRRAQGFSVEVVNVEDIYDEFNYGVLSADSLKNFLQYAKDNWQTPPKYVLLIGDGSFDPRNYQGEGNLDFVPVKIVTTVFSETGSDDALVDFNGDGLAEMAIGRIPASNAQTVTNALAKVVNFEQPAMQTLARGGVFASDVDNPPPPQGFDFLGLSTRLTQQLPAGTPTTMITRTVDSQQSLIDALNTGPYVVNYSGHGSAGVWSGSSFFSGCNIDNVCAPSSFPQLANATHESIYVMLTCLNGYFLNPFSDSLSERLFKTTSGGAVAVWASTGLTTPDVQEVMGTRFYNQLGQPNFTRMGDFILDAKAQLHAGSDVRFSWALIGDPMLKIKVIPAGD